MLRPRLGLFAAEAGQGNVLSDIHPIVAHGGVEIRHTLSLPRSLAPKRAQGAFLPRLRAAPVSEPRRASWPPARLSNMLATSDGSSSLSPPKCLTAILAMPLPMACKAQLAQRRTEFARVTITAPATAQ